MVTRLYMDYNASTPPAPGVAEAITEFFQQSWGNPSSSHAEGRRARAACEEARGRVAQVLDCASDEVVFTSGGSEADALAIRGLFESGVVDALVLGGLEHPAVMATAQWLAAQRGAVVRSVPPDRSGCITAAAVDKALEGLKRPLVSVMLAQNELGTLNPLAEISTVAKARGALLHSDAVAAFGKIPISVRQLGVDLLTVSAHKIGGPAGTGALIVGRNLRPAAFCLGGHQEQGRRPGTEALPLVVGFGVAAQAVPQRVLAAAAAIELRARLEALLLERVPGVLIAAATVPRLPNTVAAVFEDVIGVNVVAACDAAGLAVSAGAACHSATGSPTMLALGLPERFNQGLLRISFGPRVQPEEIDRAAAIVTRAVLALRGAAA